MADFECPKFKDHCIGVDDHGLSVFISDVKDGDEKPYTTFSYCPNCGAFVAGFIVERWA